MECPRCHAELDGRSRFCAACGYNVEELFSAVQDDEQEEQSVAEDMEIPSEEDVPSGEEEQLVSGTEPEVGTEISDEMVPLDDVVDDSVMSALDESQHDDLPIDFAELDEPFVAPLDEPVVVDQSATEVFVAEQDSMIEPEPAYEPLPVPEEGSYAVDVDYPERNIETDDTAQFAAISSEDASEAYTMASAYERGGIRSLLKRWKTLLVCLLCVIALIAAGISSVEWNRAQEKQTQDAAANQEVDVHTPVQVGLAIDLPGYDEAHMTPVPLHVIGSATTGEAVDELVLLQHPSSDVLSLLKGSYIVSSGGPVLSDEGDLFEGTVDSFALSIQDEGITVNGRKADAPDGKILHFIYSKVEPQNVTDNELDTARAWMLKAEIVNYQSYINAVTQKRQEAVDRLAAEQAAKEEAERQAAEEAARQAEEIKKKEEEEKKKKESEQQNTKSEQQNTTNDKSTINDSSQTNTSTDNSTYGDSNGYDSYGSDAYGYDSSGYDSGYGYDTYGYYSNDYYGV